MKLNRFDAFGATAHWRPTPSPLPQNVSYSDAVMEAFGVPQGGGSVSADSAMRVSAVAGCVAKISGAILSMPLNILRRSGADGMPEVMQPDALYYLLNEQPADGYTAASWWEGASMAQLLRGDAYALIRRAVNGSVREILPLPWGSVFPTRDERTKQVRYYVSLPTHGIQTWFSPDDVLHFPGLGYDDATLRSMSIIQYGARGAIAASLAMTQYGAKFFEGGAHPSVVLEAPGKMTEPQIALLQSAFVRKYAGLTNAHRLPLVLTEGLSAKEISLSAADAQLIEAQKFSVLDIARAFGVPPHMIGETSGSTSWGSGIESMGRAFVQYTLNPWLRKIEQELNRKLFPRDTGRFIEFDRDALTEGDSNAQQTYYRAALGGPGSGAGWMTINEVRRRKRLPPIPGGDKLFMPADQPTPKAPSNAPPDNEPAGD